MAGQTRRRAAREQAAHQALDLPRIGGADGVGDDQQIGPGIQQFMGEPLDHGRRYRPLEGALEGHGEIGLHAGAFGVAAGNNLASRGQGLVEAAVDVFAIHGLRRRHHHRDGVHAGGAGALVALDVRHQGAQFDARGRAQGACQGLGAGHLRDRSRGHETADFDMRQTGAEQRLHETPALRRAQRLVLVLQAVARPDFIEDNRVDERRAAHATAPCSRRPRRRSSL